MRLWVRACPNCHNVDAYNASTPTCGKCGKTIKARSCYKNMDDKKEPEVKKIILNDLKSSEVVENEKQRGNKKTTKSLDEENKSRESGEKQTTEKTESGENGERKRTSEEYRRSIANEREPYYKKRGKRRAERTGTDFLDGFF